RKSARMSKLASIRSSRSAVGRDPCRQSAVRLQPKQEKPMAAVSDQTLVHDVEAPEPDTLNLPGRSATHVAQVVKPDDTTPGPMERPAFLMNCPFSYSAEQPNNAWMYELDETHRRVDKSKAMCQFAQLYDHLASE